jgi:hypothetical protein
MCGFDLFFPDLFKDYSAGIYKEGAYFTTDEEDDDYTPEQMDGIGGGEEGEDYFAEKTTKDMIPRKPNSAYIKIGFDRARVTWNGDAWKLPQCGPPCCMFCGGKPFIHRYRKEKFAEREGNEESERKRKRSVDDDDDDECDEHAFKKEFAPYNTGKTKGYLGYTHLPEKEVCTIFSKDFQIVICEANPKFYTTVLYHKWESVHHHHHKDSHDVVVDNPVICGDVYVVFQVMAPIRHKWDDQSMIVFDYCCKQLGIHDINRLGELTHIATPSANDTET